MQKLPITDLKAGMMTARSILGTDGRLLLAQDTVLTTAYIERMKELGVAAIYVQNPYLKDIKIPELVRDETRYVAMQAVKECFATLRDRQVFSAYAVIAAADQLVEEIVANGNVLVHLTDIRVHDDYTFAHSVNVAILSALTLLHMGYKEKDLRVATLGALLHDVGKMHIPLEILVKPGGLTTAEMDIMRQHAELGFDILRHGEKIPLLSAHVALQHHEKNDGTGYPRGLSGDSIHPFAQVTSIADVYDAVTSDRPYRLGMAPDQAYDLLQALSGSHFSPQALTEFFAHLATYPIGSFVCLNTGAFGIVLDVPSKLPCRPLLQLVTDETGLPLSEYVTLDLTENLTAKIMRLLTPKEISALPLCQA